MRDYVIPANVVTRFEFFPDYGWRELMITVVGIAVGSVLFFAFGLVDVPVAARVIVGVVIAAVAYLSTRKIDGTFSLLIYLRLWRRWVSRPREYWLW